MRVVNVKISDTCCHDRDTRSGDTRTSVYGLCQRGKRSGKGLLWALSMEHRLGLREGERSVGEVVCGVHRQPSGRAAAFLLWNHCSTYVKHTCGAVGKSENQPQSSTA